ncbi:MAG: hypothetical protein ABIS06_15785 [Vicinamibacterales bacterium]
MPINPDFNDLFAALNATGSRYLLVGGYAVAVHAIPRFTKDLDIWIEPSADNALRVMDALRQFGAPLESLSTADLMAPGTIFQIGIPPNRIDLVMAIDGVIFSDAWASRLNAHYGDVAISVISRTDLIRNKRAVGRPQDLVDAALLEELG